MGLLLMASVDRRVKQPISAYFSVVCDILRLTCGLCNLSDQKCRLILYGWIPDKPQFSLSVRALYGNWPNNMCVLDIVDKGVAGSIDW